MSTVARISDYLQNDKLNNNTYLEPTKKQGNVTRKDYIKAYMSILTDQIERGR